MTNQSESERVAPAAARVVFVSDAGALHIYGPVLRRLAIGLIDEVQSLTLLSIGESPLLEYIPSPPIRIITEKHALPEQIPSVGPDAWQITVDTAKYDLLEKFSAKRHTAKLAEALMPFKPTLLHALSESQVSLVRQISKALKIPYVVSMLAMDKGTLNISDSRCKGVICCNGNLAKYLRVKYPEFASRISLLPIGTHVYAEPCCFNNLSCHPMAICCCSLQYNRGLNTLINSIKRLHNKGHKIQLTISGEGPGEADLRKIVQQLGLVEHVHFVPPIDAMLATSDASKHVLQVADIFIQPFHADIWRPELLEAMSVGNAVVIADGADNDLIIPGKTALSVKFQDEISLAGTLESLLNDQNKAKQLASNGQEHLRKHFLASTMITKLAQIYKKALS